MVYLSFGAFLVLVGAGLIAPMTPQCPVERPYKVVNDCLSDAELQELVKSSEAWFNERELEKEKADASEK